MSTNGSHLSAEGRERLRENARKLVDEGRWGGRGPGDDPTRTWGQGNRRSNRVLRYAQLAAVLELVASRDGAAGLDGDRRLFASVPVASLGLDRVEIIELIADVLGAALHRERVPRTVLFENGDVELVWNRRRRPRRPDARAVDLPDPRPSDFERYSDAELLDVLVLLVGCMPAPSSRAEHRAQALIVGLARQIGDAVERIIAQRSSDNVVA